MPKRTTKPQLRCPVSSRQITAGLLLFSLSFVCGGATCARRRPTADFAPPVVFNQTPTLQQLIEHTNRSKEIRRIGSNTLTISSPGMLGQLSGNLQWERPHNFSLTAYMGSRAFGTVLAAGSNADEFWLQSQMPPPPTLYSARHDDFENQPGPRRILPVSPLWLREALGIVEFDPTYEHEGPVVRADGKLEVRSLIPSPRGPYTRVLTFAPNTLALEETRLYDQSRRLVASALQSEHDYYAAVQTNLPHKVIVELIPDDGNTLSFTIDIDPPYLVNQISNAQTTAFTKPDGIGLSQVDLVQENARIGQSQQAVPPVYRSSNAASYPASLEGYRR